jgi:PAS domain S-box-containing protein
MDCPFCQALAAPSAHFCGHCGARLTPEEDVRAVLDATGGMQPFQGTTEDIARRNRAEDALRACRVEAKVLALIAARTHNTVILTDAAGRIVWANDGFDRMTGYTLDEVRGRTPGSFLQGPMSDPQISAEMRQAVRAGHEFRAEILNYHKSGRPFWVQIEAQPLHDEMGNLTHFMAIESDVTELKQTERTLRLNESRLRLALDVADMLSWDWAIGANEITFSQDYGAYYGLPPTGTVVPNDESMLVPVHPDDRWPLLDAFRQSLETGRDFHIEFRGPMRHAEQSWYVARGRILETRDGQPQRMIGITQDITVRKRAEEALRRSNEELERLVRERTAEKLKVNEDSLRLIAEREAIEKSLRLAQFTIDRAIDSVIWIGPNAEILYVNDATCRILGYSREELLGKAVSEIDPNVTAEAWPAYWEDLKRRGSVSFESKQRTKDGRLIDTEVTANYIAFEGHECSCTKVRDITDRKRAEQALAESEEKYRSLVTDVNDGIFITDPRGLVTFANPALARLTGFEHPEQIVGKNFVEFIAPAMVNEVAGYIRQAVERGETREATTVEIIRREGTIAVVEVRAKAVKEDTKVIGMKGVIRDVTLQKQAERALYRSERRFRSLVENAPVGVWQVGPDGDTIQYINPAMRRILEIPPDEDVCGNPIKEYIAPESRGIAARQKDLRQRGLSSSYEIDFLSRRNRRIPALVSGSPVVGTDGQLAALVGTTIDITDRKRSEQALWEREIVLLQSQRIARIGSWSVELATDDVKWTDETYRLYGVSRETFVPSAEAIVGLVHPDDRIPLRKHIQAFIAGKTPGPLEFRVPLSDGQERVLCGQGEAFLDDTGRPARMIGTVQDITNRKRAEQALWERETVLLQSQRIARMGSWSVDLTTGCVTWTENTYQLCGVSPETFVPSVEALIGLVHPDDRGAVQGYIQASFAGENPGDLEFRVPLPDGQVRFLCGQGEMFRDDTGRPVSMIGTVQDITERKRAEQSLRLSQFSIDRAACPIFWDGPDAKILYVNEAACRMLGYSREELTRMTICDIDPLVSPAKYAAGWAALPRQGSFTFETKHVTKDGRVLDVEVTSNVIEYEGRELDCAMVRDITERKRVEQSLRESEQRNRTILRTAMDGFWRVDIQGHLLEVNEAYCRMSGYSEQELLAMSVSDLEAVETAADAAAHIQRIMAQGTDRFESRHRRKDGSIYSIEASVQYRPVEGGQMVAFLRDITERKQAESQANELRDTLAHSKRVSILGEIASGLAHELNQPLGAIHLDANTALFLAKELDTPGLPDCLRRISEQSFRAGEIIRRMRSFIRRDSSRKAPEDINRLVREVLMLLGDHLSENAVTVDLNLAERLPPIVVDGIQIQQVLVNLIRNASEAMAQNVDVQRVLSLRTERVESEVRVSISDTGCGLDRDIAAKLFFPFQTTRPEGLGLGLSICRTLVEAHNGGIEVHPNPGRGTTFLFTIPVAS